MNDLLVPTLEDAVQAETGSPCRLTTVSPLSGGCIHSACRLTCEDGRNYFCKISSDPGAEMLERELEGLVALNQAAKIRSARPLVCGSVPSQGKEFLITEYIEPGSPRPGFFGRFGRDLAQTHRNLPAERFGFHRDNYLGSTPQPNTWTSGWCDFWREHRLGFQLELSRRNGYSAVELQQPGSELMDQLQDRIGGADEPPCLLHGDLWSGNFLVDEQGRAVLIDPAVYYGSREAELAMCRLFGGFGAGFYRSYEEAWPLQPGASQRIEIYQLYHLLNHLNLFGAGYLSGCIDLLRRILR